MAGILSSLHSGENVGLGRDYLSLRRSLDQLLADGRIRRIPVSSPMYPGFSEEWYLDLEAGDVYCLLPVAERVVPRWEKVDFSKKQHQQSYAWSNVNDSRCKGLAQFPTGRQSTGDVNLIRFLLDQMIAGGQVEPILEKPSPLDPNTREEWFRDKDTGDVYKLLCNVETGDFHWERQSNSDTKL